MLKKSIANKNEDKQSVKFQKTCNNLPMPHQGEKTWMIVSQEVCQELSQLSV